MLRLSRCVKVEFFYRYAFMYEYLLNFAWLVGRPLDWKVLNKSCEDILF